MKKILFLFTLCFPLAISAQAQSEVLTAMVNQDWTAGVAGSVDLNAYQKEDAIVVFNKEYNEYNVGYEKEIYTLTKVSVRHRKIQINSFKGLEDFISVYIPLSEDLTYKSDIVEIKARTIKKNGEKIEVKLDFIKETTLPANVPFLYGYKGKVKLFSFQNLEVGDQIEYVYTTRYKFGIAPSQVYLGDKVTMSSPYIILHNEICFNIDKDLKLGCFPYNTTATPSKIDKGKYNFYTITLKNVTKNESGIYDNDYFEQPYLYYLINKYYAEKNYESWEELLQEYITNPRSKTYLIKDMTIDKVAAVANTEANILAKTNKVLKLYNDMLTESSVYDIYSNHRFLQVDLIDALQYMKLFKLMNIPSSVVLLRSKDYGPLNKTHISLQQFDDIMIQFIAEDGQAHYFPIQKPFQELDEIAYEFAGTTAIKINGDKSFEYITIPAYKKNENSTQINSIKKITFVETGYQYESTDRIAMRGAYFTDRKHLLILYQDDNSKDFFVKNRKAIASAYYENISDFNITNPSYSREQREIKWEENYQQKIISNPAQNIVTFTMDQFIRNTYSLSVIEKSPRHENAYFDFPFDNEYNSELVFPAGYVVQDNSFLNTSFSNDIIDFSASYTKTGENSISVKFKISLKKDMVEKENWSKYLEGIDKIESFYKQKIIVVKK